MRSKRPPIGWIPDDLNPHDLETGSDLLEYCCEHYASKPVFTSLGKTITYQELNDLSAAFASYLQKETTLKRGDRIAIQLPNILQYHVVVFGALRAGLVVVNTNPLYTPREMQHQFNDSGAKALVIYQCMAHNAEQILPDTGIKYVLLTELGDMHGGAKRHIINFVVKHVKKMQPAFNLPKALFLREVLLKYAGTQPEPVKVNADSAAVLQYTGGTTGVSKGAELTHANLISNLFQGVSRIAEGVSDSWTDTVISPLPLYHIYAFTMSQAVMYCGGHSVLIPNPRDIPGFVKELKKWQFSTFLGLNTLFVALCRAPGYADLDFSKLLLTVSGGMALTQAAAEEWQRVTGCSVVEGYGLTETSPLVTIQYAR